MESDKLYRVQKEDLPKVEKMLNQCFAHDPLYETLIPDPEVRKNLMRSCLNVTWMNFMRPVRSSQTARI